MSLYYYFDYILCTSYREQTIIAFNIYLILIRRNKKKTNKILIAIYQIWSEWTSTTYFTNFNAIFQWNSSLECRVRFYFNAVEVRVYFVWGQVFLRAIENISSVQWAVTNCMFISINCNLIYCSNNVEYFILCLLSHQTKCGFYDQDHVWPAWNIYQNRGAIPSFSWNYKGNKLHSIVCWMSNSVGQHLHRETRASWGY